MNKLLFLPLKLQVGQLEFNIEFFAQHIGTSERFTGRDFQRWAYQNKQGRQGWRKDRDRGHRRSLAPAKAPADTVMVEESDCSPEGARGRSNILA